MDYGIFASPSRIFILTKKVVCLKEPFEDAMSLALANVLNLPVVLFTSIENFPVVVVNPRKQLPNTTPLYLAYRQQGTGHYDIAEFQETTSISQPLMEEVEGKTPFSIQGCRCGQGRDRKDLSKNRCKTPPGRFSCRCECFNNIAACSSDVS